MIIRILNIGRFEVSGELWKLLVKAEREVMERLRENSCSEEEFRNLYKNLFEIVKHGRRLQPYDLYPTDIILPPESLTLEQVKKIFKSTKLGP